MKLIRCGKKRSESPAELKKNEKIIIKEVEKVLNSFGHGSGHIFNLGTGITPDIKPEKVKLLVNILRDMSPKYHIE